MPDLSLPATHPQTEPSVRAEAFAEATALAHSNTKDIPAAWIAAQVLATQQTGDWPVIREGTLAILRRLDSARANKLRVAHRPSNGRVFGLYQTKRAGGAVRPYKTLLQSLTAVEVPQARYHRPIVGSCECPYFIYGSLGVCKHLLVIVADLCKKPRILKRALVGAGVGGSTHTGLRWDPIRPLLGNVSWLERVHLDRSPITSETVLRQLFTIDADGIWRLKRTHREDSRQRRKLCERLVDLIKAASRRALPSDPSLSTLLRDEIANIDRQLTCRHAQKNSVRFLATMRRELYDYQRLGVQRFLENGRLLLADDMGLGKTAQAIGASTVMWRAGLVRRGLLIVPASLKNQWCREWHAFTDVPITIVAGAPVDRRAMYRSTRQGFLVANYEQVLRDLELMQGFAPDLIILDEAQRIKNWSTQTARCVKRLLPQYRMVLTGTPFENRLIELASVFEWVDQSALEPKWRLVPWHTVTADGSREIIGARNLDVLRDRMDPTLLRRRRAEILTELPSRTDTRVGVTMTHAQTEAHDELSRPIARLIQAANRRPLRQEEFLRLMSLLNSQRVISNGLAQLDYEEVWPAIAKLHPAPALLDRLDSPKLIEFREIFMRIGLQQERKIVVFSQWRRMLDLAHWAISVLLRDAGQRAAFFTGRESQRRRTQNVIDFHDDAATTVLFATDAGGTGLNLQRASTCCVNLEMPWNPAVLEQRIARIHRLGQEFPIDVYDLVSDSGIEDRIATLVADKGALFRSVFDGDSDSVQFDGSGSFLESVRQIVPEDTNANSVSDDIDEESQDEPRIEAIVAAADDGEDVGDGLPGAASADTIRGLFDGIKVEQTSSGGLRIDAGPEQAAALAALLEGVAGMLRGAKTS